VEPYSQAIARFVRGLNLEEVPQPVVDKAKLVFLDYPRSRACFFDDGLRENGHERGTEAWRCDF
jgi:hypothetical protein